MSLRVLVTGGAGYIGAHAVLALQEAGHAPVVIDDLSTGLRAAIPDGVPLVTGCVGDADLVRRTLAAYSIEAVMHFAGSIVVPESVIQPLKYYRNNTANSFSLIESCVTSGVRLFVFSSTAAVYGIPEQVPVPETAPVAPINPYGASKAMTERMLQDAGEAHGLRTVILRYFNVAGADPKGRVGQSTADATHLIKVAAQAALGRRPCIEVFGEDYPTADGTGVRDYIHVSDLARAHVLALEYLRSGSAGAVLNCGYGHGYSVRDVLTTMARVCGTALPVHAAPRRAGDPPCLIAEASRIRKLLHWQPEHDRLEFIIRTALDWERRLAPQPATTGHD